MKTNIIDHLKIKENQKTVFRASYSCAWQSTGNESHPCCLDCLNKNVLNLKGETWCVKYSRNGLPSNLSILSGNQNRDKLDFKGIDGANQFTQKHYNLKTQQ